MGCNTSKESTVPAADGEEKKDEKGGVEKPESAKTVTLTSNGTVLSGADSATGRDSKESGTKGLDQAATKIQAVFRGHQSRKSMKQAGKQEESSEIARKQLQQEFRSDDGELCHAATKIQASFRGHMLRKQMEKKENETDHSKEKKNENDEELDIDLSDPDLNKAAVKIQASFRGHMVRKEHEDEPETHPRKS